MKKSKISLICFFLSLFLLANCGGGGTKFKTITRGPKAPLTDECRTMEEICQSYKDFRKEYDRMPEEQRKEMVTILNTYIEHCENAEASCEESNKKKK